MILFSIIIPVKAINDYIKETVPCIQKIKRKDWELIILPNEKVSQSEIQQWQDKRIRFVHSGAVGPAKKRDMGAKAAKGSILVFLDDDSYPNRDFLDIAEKYINTYSSEKKNQKKSSKSNKITEPISLGVHTVVALGGPAITPPHDTFWQRVSGAVFLSKFSGGAPERYVPVGKAHFVDDWPTVNFMVERKTFLEIGGFNSPYWPGEDTKFCLDLIQKTGKKILYIPEMKVWHHRRAGLLAHLKQIGGYGLHRGYFAKKYPETSFRLMYFIPSLFLVFFIFTIMIIFLRFFIDPSLKKIIFLVEPFFIMGWCLYGINLLLAFRDMCLYESKGVALVALAYTFLTQLWYGLRFIKGLLTKKLISKLR